MKMQLKPQALKPLREPEIPKGDFKALVESCGPFILPHHYTFI